MSWWVWILIGWSVLGVVVTVPAGLAMREADRRDRAAAVQPPLVRPVRAPWAPVEFHPPRRRIPVPPVGLLLAGTGMALEALGFALRVTGADRDGTARLLSMDAPLSAPRMFITAIFLVTALAASFGATRAAGRRAWWLAIGLVASLAAVVKGGGTVHVRVLEALGASDRPAAALAGSVALVAGVVAALSYITRSERRDRRRVLLAVALYGLAAGGLSAVSTAVAQARGSASMYAAASTFVEEGAEVVCAVAVLLAVLTGVAPRLILPADWALRRTADGGTVDVPVSSRARRRTSASGADGGTAPSGTSSDRTATAGSAVIGGHTRATRAVTDPTMKGTSA